MSTASTYRASRGSANLEYAKLDRIMTDKENLGEVLFEFSQVGNMMRVSALHVASNTEISMVGPANAPRVALQNTALQKLRYVLAKQKGE
jgi:hypothetical protein